MTALRSVVQRPVVDHALGLALADGQGPRRHEVDLGFGQDLGAQAGHDLVLQGVHRLGAIGHARLGQLDLDRHLVQSLQADDVVAAHALYGHQLVNDEITGMAGNDTLYGDSGDDTLSGGDDNDTLYGGAGNDVLSGDGGDDHLEGGVGDDTYLFDAFSGADTILDTEGQNRIAISGVSGSQIWLTHSGDDLLIGVVGGTATIRIQGYYASSAPSRMYTIATSDQTLFLAYAGPLINAMSALFANAPDSIGQ